MERNMFMVRNRRFGREHVVFTAVDPEKDGYVGKVEKGVTLDFDMLGTAEWPDGAPRPDPQLGRDPGNPKHYKVFKNPAEIKSAKFDLVQANTPIIVFS